MRRPLERPGDVLRTLVAFALFGALYASCLRLVERPGGPRPVELSEARAVAIPKGLEPTGVILVDKPAGPTSFAIVASRA